MKEQDIKREEVELEDGSDIHMNAPLGDFKPVGEDEEEKKVIMIPQSKISDSFISDVENAIGSLPYNHTVQVINNDRLLNLTIGNFIQLIIDNKESIDINTLNFICECLTYYPYIKVKDIINKIQENQSTYFVELKPKEVEVF